MRVSSNNTGMLLAVVAGVFSLALVIWPLPPQAQEFSSPLWFVLTVLVAGAYIASAVLADRHLGWSRVLLFGGAVVQGISGLSFGHASSLGPIAAFIDLFPAVLALVAGMIIGPRQRRAVP